LSPVTQGRSLFAPARGWPIQRGRGVELDPLLPVDPKPSVLHVRTACGGRLFSAKLGVVVHYLPHQLLDHFDRGTRCSGQKRDLGDPSLALSDGCNGLRMRSLSPRRVAVSNRPTVTPLDRARPCIRCKLDASVTIRPPLPTPVQQVSPIRAETDLLQRSANRLPRRHEKSI
jgi:hypothetical protein